MKLTERSAERVVKGVEKPGERLIWAVLVVLIAPALAWIWAYAGHGVAALAIPELLLRLALFALLEEIVFRGGLQAWLAGTAWLRGRCWVGVSAANVLTSLAFAAAHGLTQGPLQAVAIFPVSLLFGLALERTGRLAAPIALHLYFNGLLWLASWLQSGA